MKIMRVNENYREMVTSFIKERWFTTEMVIRGNIIDMTRVQGIIAMDEKENILGLITYMIKDLICEITSLDSLKGNRGTGIALVREMIRVAEEEECEKIIVVTTNDNINALRFYQKRGFDMVRIYHNALDISRSLKPEIPLVGENDIPLKHEIEFELLLNGRDELSIMQVDAAKH